MPDYQTDVPKPYSFTQFPNKPPVKKKPVGHHKYLKTHIHGTLHLELKVGTGVHVSTGRIVMGKDVEQNNTPLIQTMVDGGKNIPAIPGSSLKGVIRSVYEAITTSCICKVQLKGTHKNKLKEKLSFQFDIPRGYKECLPKNDEIKGRTVELCPACKIFGAMNFQGLVRFQDARLEKTLFETGFMPSLHEPQKDCTEYCLEQTQNIQNKKLTGDLVGRKFYYHAEKAVEKGSKGIPVQKVGEQKIFHTKVQLKNLTFAEFGTLLIALGQDSDYQGEDNSFALKVGAGKPIGMGTMIVNPVKFEQATSLKQRYSNYENSVKELTGEKLVTVMKEAIKQSHYEELVQLAQLQELSEILKYPTNRQAPTDMY